MLSNGECDLHPQEHPIVDKDLRLDDFQSFEFRNSGSRMNLSWIPWKSLFFAFLLQLVSRMVFLVSRLFTISMSMRSSLLDDILGN